MSNTTRLAAVAILLSALAAIPAHAGRSIERHIEGPRGAGLHRNASHAPGEHERSLSRSGVRGGHYEHEATREHGSITRERSAVRPGGASVERSATLAPGDASATQIRTRPQGATLTRTRDAWVDDGALHVERSATGPEGQAHRTTRTYERPLP